MVAEAHALAVYQNTKVSRSRSGHHLEARNLKLSSVVLASFQQVIYSVRICITVQLIFFKANRPIRSGRTLLETEA